MLKLLFKLRIAADRAVATRQQQCDARERARYAIAVHGADAHLWLIRKLRDPRRRQSRRVIRLAVAEAIRA